MGADVHVRNLSAWFGATRVLHDITMDILPNHVTAIVGPSGCGKSTFIRCLNRMHELTPGARVEGSLRIGTMDVYAPGMSTVEVRRSVGMVFQKPTPFPTMSIYDNVAAGLELGAVYVPEQLDEIVEQSLRQAALWDEVKDHLKKKSGASLSVGQQQRLCIARALAVTPEVLLMDEPTSALDPLSTGKIEDLLYKLRENFTVVIVTHNMRQAARVAEHAAFFLLGELVEYDRTERIFTTPTDKRTEDYVTGRFG